MKSPTSVLGLDAAARGLGKRLPVYLEVKLSHEEAKHGMQPVELPELLQAIAGPDSLVALG